MADCPKHIEVVFNGITLADTTEAKRVLETSHPSTYYIPPKDIVMAYLIETSGRSFYEWKGIAGYYSVVVKDRTAEKAAWYCPNPKPGYLAIKDHIAFYPGFMDVCHVDGERVRPQPGGFYGGWITRDIVGPFKGDPGTLDW